MLKAQQMVGLGRPAARDYESVEAYIFDKKPLVDEEMDFIYQKEDLITIRHGREVAMLDAFTERMLQIFHCPMLQVWKLIHTGEETLTYAYVCSTCSVQKPIAREQPTETSITSAKAAKTFSTPRSSL